MADSLRLHEPQRSRLLCPSLSPMVCSNSCLLRQWSLPTILSSVIPFLFCLQSLPVSGSFPVSWLFASGSQIIVASASVLPLNIQKWFPLGLAGFISLQSMGLLSLLWHHSSKVPIFQSSVFFMGQLPPPYITTGRTIALTIVTEQQQNTMSFIKHGRCWFHWSCFLTSFCSWKQPK